VKATRIVALFLLAGFPFSAYALHPASPKITPAGAQELIGLVDNSDFRYLDGCGCSVQPPSKGRNQRDHYYLLTELGDATGKRAWMNIDGRVTALSLSSTTGPAPKRRGSKFTEVYKGGGATARLTYTVSSPSRPGGEVTKYTVTITVTKGNRSQTVRAVGDCGC
jgi:hypothetical protein